MQRVVDTYVPKYNSKEFRGWAEKHGVANWEDDPIPHAVCLIKNGPGQGVGVGVKFSSRSVLGFTFQTYPSCCGLQMLHTFHARSGFNDIPLFNKLMDAAFADAVIAVFGRETGWNSRRIQIMMVERRSHNQETTRLINCVQGHLAELKPIPGAQVDQHPIWEWAHSKKKVITTLMLNNNTNNVIHNMEVLFDRHEPLFTLEEDDVDQ